MDREKKLMQNDDSETTRIIKTPSHSNDDNDSLLNKGSPNAEIDNSHTKSFSPIITHLVQDNDDMSSPKSVDSQHYKKKYCFDYISTAILSAILGASIGLGETSWHTSFKEMLFVAGVIGLMVLPLLAYYGYKRYRNEHIRNTRIQSTQYYLKLLLPALFSLCLSYGVVQYFNTTGKLNSIFDQQHSRAASDWASKTFHSDPLKFQVLSYQFGYMLPAMIFVFLIACAYYRKQEMQYTEDKQICKNQLKKNEWIKMLFFGSVLTCITLSINSGLQKVGAAFSHSIRPIVGDSLQNVGLHSNTWADISSFNNVENAGSSGTKNWPSGHVALMATLFWLSVVYVKVCYDQHRAKRYNNSRTKFVTNNIGKILLTCCFFGMMLATADFRVFGKAHTISAVVGSFIIPLFTVLLSIGIFKGIRVLISKVDCSGSSLKFSTSTIHQPVIDVEKTNKTIKNNEPLYDDVDDDRQHSQTSLIT